MKLTIVIAIALALAVTGVSAQHPRDERDLSGSGAMSVEELRREPIIVDLDIPYADSGNPGIAWIFISRSTARATGCP